MELYQLHLKKPKEITTKELDSQWICLPLYSGDTLSTMKMKPPTKSVLIHIWYIFETLIVIIMCTGFLISWHAYLSLTSLDFGFQMQEMKAFEIGYAIQTDK